LITLAGEADRATIHNGTAPPIPPLPEPDIADMEYFISQMQLVLPVLGFNFLQAKPGLFKIWGCVLIGMREFWSITPTAFMSIAVKN
jgi:hypothetical protein